MECPFLHYFIFDTFLAPPKLFFSSAILLIQPVYKNFYTLFCPQKNLTSNWPRWEISNISSFMVFFASILQPTFDGIFLFLFLLIFSPLKQEIFIQKGFTNYPISTPTNKKILMVHLHVKAFYYLLMCEWR